MPQQGKNHEEVWQDPQHFSSAPWVGEGGAFGTSSHRQQCRSVVIGRTSLLISDWSNIVHRKIFQESRTVMMLEKCTRFFITYPQPFKNLFLQCSEPLLSGIFIRCAGSSYARNMLFYYMLIVFYRFFCCKCCWAASYNIQQ